MEKEIVCTCFYKDIYKEHNTQPSDAYVTFYADGSLRGSYWEEDETERFWKVAEQGGVDILLMREGANGEWHNPEDKRRALDMADYQFVLDTIKGALFIRDLIEGK